MRLPFSPTQFFHLFETYNHAIGISPAVVAAIAALLVLVSTLARWRAAGRAALALLAVLWMWNGVAYHGIYFTRINPAAYAFALLFVAQGLIFAALALGKNIAQVRLGRDAASVAGAALIGYALLVYPLWGALLGHGYPAGPIFGVAPCPTTIFTFGILVWLRPRRVTLALAIPTLWALIGTAAAVQLGVHQDYGLPVAAAVAVLAPILRFASTRKPQAAMEGCHATRSN